MSGGRRHRDEEKAPAGITAPEKHPSRVYPGTDRVWLDDGLKILAHPATAKAFEVTPSHELLPAPELGVRFKVEDTVPEPADLAMPTITRGQSLEITKAMAATFYAADDGGGWRGQHRVGADDIKIEQASATPGTLVYAGASGFLGAALTAFARHLPLSLAPDHVWSLISYAFAKHVDQNAEALRSKFVQHAGKKRLVVQVAPSFSKSGGNPGRGAPPARWEAEVFPNFSSQIREHIGAETHDAIAGGFSTTTAGARAAHEITLMSAMKNYFSYGISTMCGIPNVTLRGAEADWVGLRARAEALGDKMIPGFRDQWLPVLLPVLDQFVAAYRGEVNHGFWQSMVKMRHKSAMGSGESSADYITGWIQILYPYLKDGHYNSGLQPWEQCYHHGPKTSDFPSTISSCPVDWDGANLHFHAGIAGFSQDPADGALSPLLGWHVTIDPPQMAEAAIKKIKAEVVALKQGLVDSTGTSYKPFSEEQTRINELESQLRILRKQQAA